jgi:hypothetical protein
MTAVSEITEKSEVIEHRLGKEPTRKHRIIEQITSGMAEIAT